MGDRLATIDMGRKLGCFPFWEGEARPPSNTMSPWPRPSSVRSGILIHPAVWPQQTWAENGVGDCAPLGRGAGFPSHTMWPGPAESYLRAKFHLDPSNRLATTCQCHRQSGQDTQTDRQTDRQRTDSMGRTVLQTVAQK